MRKFFTGPHQSILVDWSSTAKNSPSVARDIRPTRDWALGTRHETGSSHPAKALRALEESLGWPEQTLSVLYRAFEARLNRKTPWYLDAQTLSRSGVSSDAWKKAAEVFRRGVPFDLEIDCEIDRDTESRRSEERAESSQHAQHRNEDQHGQYPVHVYDFDARWTGSQPHNQQQDLFWVIDSQVWQHHTDRLKDLPNRYVLEVSEHKKSLTTVAQLRQAWLNAGSPHTWVGVGGGILSDMVGFCAQQTTGSFHLVPTTLLAMLDASVGGKTGVNFAPYGKNQIGAFAFPKSVDIWPGWLESLPEQHIRSGAAEGIKHALLQGDSSGLKAFLGLASRTHQAPTQDPDPDQDVDHIDQNQDRQATHKHGGLDARGLLASLKLKADVVQRDPFEQGERATLNLGHTLAHVLEAYSQKHTKPPQTLLHGEAVAYGLAYALLLSERRVGFDASELKALLSNLQDSSLLSKARLEQALACRLDQSGARSVWQELAPLLRQDKKHAGQEDSYWILLTSAGQVYKDPDGHYLTAVSLAETEATWNHFLECLV